MDKKKAVDQEVFSKLNLNMKNSLQNLEQLSQSTATGYTNHERAFYMMRHVLRYEFDDESVPRI